MGYLITAAMCCALLAGCGGKSSSGTAPRQQTDPTATVSELRTQWQPPLAPESPPVNGKLPASLKPPRT